MDNTIFLNQYMLKLLSVNLFQQMLAIWNEPDQSVSDKDQLHNQSSTSGTHQSSRASITLQGNSQCSSKKVATMMAIIIITTTSNKDWVSSLIALLFCIEYGGQQGEHRPQQGWYLHVHQAREIIPEKWTPCQTRSWVPRTGGLAMDVL